MESWFSSPSLAIIDYVPFHLSYELSVCLHLAFGRQLSVTVMRCALETRKSQSGLLCMWGNFIQSEIIARDETITIKELVYFIQLVLWKTQVRPRVNPVAQQYFTLGSWKMHLKYSYTVARDENKPKTYLDINSGVHHAHTRRQAIYYLRKYQCNVVVWEWEWFPNKKLERNRWEKGTVRNPGERSSYTGTRIRRFAFVDLEEKWIYH